MKPIDDNILAAVAKHVAAVTGRNEAEVLKDLQRSPASHGSGLEGLARLFGVTRMPEPLRWFTLQELQSHLPEGFTLESDSVHVTFNVDIDESGNVTATAAPPSLELQVHGTVVEVRGEDVRIVPERGKVPPVLLTAVLAAARTMRFRPAERDGRPTSIRGLTLGAHYSRADFSS